MVMPLENKKIIICDGIKEKLKPLGCTTCHVCWSEGLFDHPTHYVVIRGISGWQRYRKIIDMDKPEDTIIEEVVCYILLELL
jgi:hypothetical protein